VSLEEDEKYIRASERSEAKRSEAKRSEAKRSEAKRSEAKRSELVTNLVYVHRQEIYANHY